jgi:hypothetical protein
MAKTDRGNHDQETEFQSYIKSRAEQRRHMNRLTAYNPASQTAIVPLEDILPSIVPSVYGMMASLEQEESKKH